MPGIRPLLFACHLTLRTHPTNPATREIRTPESLRRYGVALTRAGYGGALGGRHHLPILPLAGDPLVRWDGSPHAGTHMPKACPKARKATHPSSTEGLTEQLGP